MADNVNYPEHYRTGGIETIDFIEAKQLDYHLGNAVKYITRAGKKDPNTYVEDLQKAIWYIQRKIDTPVDPDINPDTVSDETPNTSSSDDDLPF